MVINLKLYYLAGASNFDAFYYSIPINRSARALKSGEALFLFELYVAIGFYKTVTCI